MAEQISKLTPNRDLQCYFLTPSAVAAMSQASENAFTVSGKWRQQFDWAVVEWNRDNVFEHPLLRYLPDGDLSGLVLTYDEQRTGCIPLESNLVPVVDWDNLRIWAPGSDGITETVYHVELARYKQPIAGSYVAASATMTLVASPEVNNRVGVALLENHHYYIVQAGDSLDTIASGIASAINGNVQTPGNPDFSATSNGASITITWKPGGLYPQLLGANGNRITTYGFVQGGAAVWEQTATTFSGGEFPTLYRISIDFGALKSIAGIPTDQVRKLRWTWAADLAAGGFAQTEFQVNVSNWTVTGSNLLYSVAGPGSRRIEDSDQQVSYTGDWTISTGNFSGSKIHSTSNPGDTVTVNYSEGADHQLYLGTRRSGEAAAVSVAIDGVDQQFALGLSGEDELVRWPLGLVTSGSHVVTVAHAGREGQTLFLDFIEIAYPSANLPEVAPQNTLALATDWDTYHSQSLPAERTAWMINKLGFQGRLNHYTGALWFYELNRPGTRYASLTAELVALPYTGSPTVVLAITPVAVSGQTTPQPTLISHLVLLDDTPATVAIALAGLINLGTNAIWATANGNTLTFTARAMGVEGNGVQIRLDPSSEGYQLSAPSEVLSGGVDGTPYDLDPTDELSATLMATAEFWQTDLQASPPINRAARDWHTAFFQALKGYGIDVVASFSTELLNADPSPGAGLAQRYPDGSPVVLNTPAIQTNFSPTALAFWTGVYLEMARLQASAGLTPYLQAGEVQWWYFPKVITNPTNGTTTDIGMPFYDVYTQQQFQTEFGVSMQTILDNTVDPYSYTNETAFLPTLIGNYTAAIRGALRVQYPSCRFEVLYPTDTNSTTFNQLINFPAGDWTPTNLTCLKTESFTSTGSYDLDLSTYSMSVSAAKGFPSLQRSHLIGISDGWTAWMKEAAIAQSQGLESVVLFALDQFCLIGYPLPPFISQSRSNRQG